MIGLFCFHILICNFVINIPNTQKIMKILLLGEYSRLHLTLMENLKLKGHDVLLVSDGDGYKDYYRDVDISRRGDSLSQALRDTIRIMRIVKSFKGFDVVQLINPCFTTLNIRVNRYLYKCLLKQNKKVFLGAFGVDYFWLKAAKDKQLFRYSEFHIGEKDIYINYAQSLIEKWGSSSYQTFNTYVAEHSNGIIACLYEYYVAYHRDFQSKLKYIPLPIDLRGLQFHPIAKVPESVVFFIGIDKDRTEFKGTNLLLEVLNTLQQKYGDQIKILVAESVSYSKYLEMLHEAHVVLDQIYSYSPSVNPLQAMALGKVVVSGGEPKIYQLLDKDIQVKPIHNVLPTEESILAVLNNIVENKHLLPEWSLQSRKFVEQYHDADIVSDQYLEFWNKK